jgi:hypothetical protein
MVDRRSDNAGFLPVLRGERPAILLPEQIECGVDRPPGACRTLNGPRSRDKSGPFHFSPTAPPDRAWETDMAKGQKRSNKEVKKPKADKKPAVVAAPSPFAKAGPAPAGGKKKR